MPCFTPFRFKAYCVSACVVLIAFAGLPNPAAAQSREVMDKATAAPAKAKEVPKAPGQPRVKVVYRDRVVAKPVERVVYRDRPVAAASTPAEVGTGWNDGDAMFTKGTEAFKTQQFAEARRYYTRAAELENDEAMRLLGELYEFGFGVKRDTTHSFFWYKKAAAAGNSLALNHLGMIYSGYGSGNVKQDFVKARYWFQKGADAGDPRCMFNLGGMYKSGEGGKKDYSQARYWYQKAADAGYESAKQEFEEIKNK